jgi:serine/threonine protein kinase
MLLLGVEYLHSNFIVHRDLKPSNIFIDKIGKNKDFAIFKIGDFGISKIDLDKMKKTMTETMGKKTTPAYIAPEVIKGEAPTRKVDIWALGIILY